MAPLPSPPPRTEHVAADVVLTTGLRPSLMLTFLFVSFEAGTGLCLSLPPSVQSTTSTFHTPPHRIAVIGGGLAGLATSFHLLNISRASGIPLHSLDVFDASEPGEGGASAVAAGLLHPFSPKSRELWSGTDGFQAATQLIDAVQEHTKAAVSERRGLLRLALDDEQAAVLSDSVSACDTEALEQQLVDQQHVAGLAGSSTLSVLGAYAPTCITVDTKAYLRGLWSMCCAFSETEVAWRVDPITSLASLQQRSRQYDAVIVAAGAKCTSIAELHGLPLKLCRGQNLILANEPANLKLPLISKKYVMPILGSNGKRLLVGATFEYEEAERAHRAPDQPAAEAHLREAIGAFFPPAATLPVVACQAGVRAIPPRTHFGYVPVAGRLPVTLDRMDGGVWMFTGLGSRGLIHHALLAKQVASAVVTGDEACIDSHVRRLSSKLPDMISQPHELEENAARRGSRT